jgi:hypothetical protein
LEKRDRVARQQTTLKTTYAGRGQDSQRRTEKLDANKQMKLTYGISEFGNCRTNRVYSSSTRSITSGSSFLMTSVSRTGRWSRQKSVTIDTSFTVPMVVVINLMISSAWWLRWTREWRASGDTMGAPCSNSEICSSKSWTQASTQSASAAYLLGVNAGSRIAANPNCTS